MQESLLAYRRMRYLWAAGALAAAAILAYALHRPPEPPNGGTWLGYTLGGIAAALVLLLGAFSIRKRAYASTLGSVRGWLSAHVYLGLALLVVMTLHAGFQFGWNVHTLAYALACVVVASGIVGVWFYLRYPEQMSRNRAGETREQMLAELADLDRLCAKQAAALGGEFPDVIVSARDRAALGGSAWAILAGRDRSRVVLPGAHGGGHAQPNAGQSRLVDWLGHELAGSTDGERTRLIHELMALVNTRRGLLERLRRDAQIRGWLDAWLYVHVPATCALLAALAAHVLVVFLYW
ncbi:MAG: hypothetical protein KF822_05930 [Steroidobacteraceae bacterium]|nr:hypothetical protein [Steroidobacteraceae bacterium]